MLANGEPIICRFISRALATANHEVLIASTKDETLTMARNHAPDLVLVDLWLSGAHDLDLVRRLATDDGPVVVVLSDPPTEGERKQAFEAGAADYISMPASLGEVSARVEQALAAHCQLTN